MVTRSASSPEHQAPTVVGGIGTTIFVPPPLTQVEREILSRVAGGQTDGQIATALFMSRRTVQNHLRRIREKTGLRTRAELILWASRLDPPGPRSGPEPEVLGPIRPGSDGAANRDR